MNFVATIIDQLFLTLLSSSSGTNGFINEELYLIVHIVRNCLVDVMERIRRRK